MQGDIRLVDPETVNEFTFVRAFETRMGVPQNPRFTLSYEITTDSTGQAITESNNITRFNITGEAAYAVTPLNAEEPILQGQVSTFTSYSATATSIATLSAERDAEARLMTLLADQIITRLLVSPALQ